jgi:hypothetical protein
LQVCWRGRNCEASWDNRDTWLADRMQPHCRHARLTRRPVQSCRKMQFGRQTSRRFMVHRADDPTSSTAPLRDRTGTSGRAATASAAARESVANAAWTVCCTLPSYTCLTSALQCRHLAQAAAGKTLAGTQLVLCSAKAAQARRSADMCTANYTSKPVNSFMVSCDRVLGEVCCLQ